MVVVQPGRRKGTLSTVSAGLAFLVAVVAAEAWIEQSGHATRDDDAAEIAGDYSAVVGFGYGTACPAAAAAVVAVSVVSMRGGISVPLMWDMDWNLASQTVYY